MFLERARAVGALATVDPEASAEILAICRKLNGLPLAIELAAARTKHISLADLRVNLEQRLDVLSGGPRDVPKRHRTMRDAVAWSVDLLGEDARRLLGDLSMFAGGWTLESVTAVSERESVLDPLGDLVDKSLVRRPVDGRYDLLDVIHEYVAEWTGPQSEAAARHIDYFIGLGERAEPELGGRGQRDWLARLAIERDNIRVALRRAIEAGDAERALRLSSAVWRYWLLRSDLAEGRAWLRQALALDGGSMAFRAKALWGAAWLAYHHGDYDDTEHLRTQLTRLADALGDPMVRRNALTVLGLVDLARERPGDAVAAFQEGLDLVRNLDSGWLIPTSYLNLGIALIHAGGDATPVLEEAKRRYVELGDAHFEARCDGYLGYAALVRGDVDGAKESFRKSLIQIWEIDDLWGTAEALEGLAACAGGAGDIVRAGRIAGAAAHLRERTTGLPFPADQALRERWLERARAAGRASAWDVAYAEGRSMTAEDAVAFALG